MSMTVRILAVIAVVFGIGLLFTFEYPPMETRQMGYRGTGMEQVFNPENVRAQIAANQPAAPVDILEPSGELASEVYQNVQVLGHLSETEFLTLMTAITEWVSPEQGCSYCHAEGEDFSSDSVYTKVVSRRMLQMTQHINTDWNAHVGATGVTCYTCHRGNPVPRNIWFTEPGQPHTMGLLGDPGGQNQPAAAAGLASLPFDPFTPFLVGGGRENEIRVAGPTALPNGNNTSIKQTEWTYGLMMHMSTSLGVNCTYCHNSRSFSDWSQSSPARVSAWHGIRMVRDLNAEYLDPLLPVYPSHRLGVLGDAPKANCTTCHQGIYKPLYGASMPANFPGLRSAQAAVPVPADVPGQPEPAEPVIIEVVPVPPLLVVPGAEPAPVPNAE